MPLKGKRRLVYAFDDYAPGARAMGNGLIMGNGLPVYTVSQDLQNNRQLTPCAGRKKSPMPG